MRPLIISMALLAIAAGCARDNGTRNLTVDEGNALQARHSEFEKMEDPKVKPGTHYAAGLLAEANGNDPAALRQFYIAVHKEPKYVDAWFRIATVQTRRREFSKAIFAWQKYVELTDKNATAYSNLAFCYELAGMLKQADTNYRRGIEIDPRNEPCRVNYGLMLARHGAFARARVQMLAVLPAAQVHYNIGAVHERQGRLEHAVHEYELALKANPSLEAAKVRLARLTESPKGNLATPGKAKGQTQATIE